MKALLLFLLLILIGCKSVNTEKDILVEITYNARKSGNVYRIKAKDVLDFAVKVKVLKKSDKIILARLNIRGISSENNKSGLPIVDIFQPIGTLQRGMKQFLEMKHNYCEGCALVEEVKVFRPFENDFDPNLVVNKEYKVKFTVQVPYLKFGSDDYELEEIEQSIKVVFEE